MTNYVARDLRPPDSERKGLEVGCNSKQQKKGFFVLRKCYSCTVVKKAFVQKSSKRNSVSWKRLRANIKIASLSCGMLKRAIRSSQSRTVYAASIYNLFAERKRWPMLTTWARFVVRVKRSSKKLQNYFQLPIKGSIFLSFKMMARWTA